MLQFEILTVMLPEVSSFTLTDPPLKLEICAWLLESTPSQSRPINPNPRIALSIAHPHALWRTSNSHPQLAVFKSVVFMVVFIEDQ